jgi:uncharacterized alkaline shock family protein YloU
MPERRVPGRSAVTRRAITDIVRSAVLGSYGIAGFASPRPIDRLIRWLRLDEPAIRIRHEEGLRVALHVRVAYGLPVAEVARQVDSAVRFAVGRALGRQIDALTINVDGLDDEAGSGPPATGAHDSQMAPVGAPDSALADHELDAEPKATPDARPNGRTSDGRSTIDRRKAGRTRVAPTGGQS